MLNIINAKRFFIFILVAIFPSTLCAHADNKKLDAIHKNIIKKYPDITHINAKAFATTPKPVLLFDVREKKEYAASHLKGALQLDPDTSRAQFIEQYGDQLDGHTLIFYCSVGRRSARMIDRLDTAPLKANAQQVYNLEGGIFRWHNDSRPLFQGSDPTKKVHPYNWFWGRSLTNSQDVSFKP